MSGRTLVVAFAAAICGSALTLGVQQWSARSSTAGDSEVGEILATVDGHAITLDDFKAEMERRGGAENFQLPEARRQALDDMIELEVLAANARRQGYLDEYEMRRRVKSVAASRYREEHLEQPLLSVAVGDDEVRAYYEAHQEKYAIPAAAHAALIYVGHPRTVPQSRVTELAERAATIRGEALQQDALEDFGPLAARYSDDQASRYRGGDVGWIEVGQRDSRFAKEVIDALFALEKPGALSEVVATETGFYVIRLLATKAASVRPLAKVAAGIQQDLLREKRSETHDRLYAAAESAVSIDVDERRLAAIEVPRRAIGSRRVPPPLPEG
ncbi:MAG: peptidylprolyl isomerase [Candidatus Binatia bacterium]